MQPEVFLPHDGHLYFSACEEDACRLWRTEARHVYREPGVYTVTLRVERTSPEGGTETSEARVEVEVVTLCKPCLL